MMSQQCSGAMQHNRSGGTHNERLEVSLPRWLPLLLPSAVAGAAAAVPLFFFPVSMSSVST